MLLPWQLVRHSIVHMCMFVCLISGLVRLRKTSQIYWTNGWSAIDRCQKLFQPGNHQRAFCWETCRQFAGDQCRGRLNFGYGFGYGAKTASEMTFGPVSVSSSVVLACRHRSTIVLSGPSLKQLGLCNMTAVLSSVHQQPYTEHRYSSHLSCLNCRIVVVYLLEFVDVGYLCKSVTSS